VRVFDVYDLLQPLLNSLFVVAMAVPLTILTASGAGFALAQLSNRLSRRLVLLTIILMIVPLPVLWLPRFVMFSSVGLIDSLFALIVPALMGTSPFFVLVFYWTFRRVPPNLFDAARLDGASTIQTWWLIALPAARTSIVVVSVLTFTLYWNDYMSSLIYLRSESLYTLSLRLQQFMTQDLGNQPLAMAASVLAILPVLLLVLAIQRYLWSDDRS
jgi:multiple sugar transport system permease protein